MGCDIHMVVEKKENSKWRCLLNPNESFRDRNYNLFAKLGNVRNYHEIIPLSDNRKAPRDSCKEWKEYAKSWGSDLHSESHLYLYELELSLDLYEYWDKFVKEIEKHSSSPNKDDIRIVFAFDN